MLTKREKHLQNQMDEQDNIARKNVNANKGSKSYFHSSDPEALFAFRTGTQRADSAGLQLPKQHYGGRRTTNTSLSRPKRKC